MYSAAATDLLIKRDGLPQSRHSGTIVFDSDIPDNAVSVKTVSTSYELLSDEDLEEIFNL